MYELLIGISLKSAVILTSAWLVAWAMRGRSAAARHVVWTAAAAAILALPLLSMGLPSWRVAIPRSLAPANPGVIFHVLVTADAPASDAAAEVPRTAAGSTAARLAAAPIRWQQWILAAWALGAALMLLRMLVAYWHLRRLRVRSSVWDDGGACRALADSLGIATPVALLEGASGSMPMTAGVLHPAIFLPAGAAAWGDERRRVVLLHELAHVRRGDVAAHMTARAALSLNWWNPLAWLAWRELLKESERAADDLVLAAGAKPSDYAGHLLEVARSMQPPASAVLGAVAMARRAELEGRLLAILDSRVRRMPAGRGSLLSGALAAVLLAAPFAAVQAQDQSTPAPPELDATIRAANSQKNHEILEHAASAYEAQRKFEVAHTLLENALTIRGQVSGTQSADYAVGLVKLGDLELKRGHVKDAEQFYMKAVSLGDRPEVAGALVYLGIQAIREDQNAAHDYFQRAVNTNPEGPQSGPAYTWLAEMKSGTPDGAVEAESLYQKALAVEDPNTAAAATTMHLYARFLEAQGRTDEAETMAKRARDVTQSTATATNLRFRSTTTLGPNGYVSTGVGSPTTNTPPMPPSAGVVKVGGGVSAPVLLRKVEPDYTEEARAAKYQGTVLLYIEVGPDGFAHNIQVLRGLGLGLDEKAIDAVSRWQFKPGQKEGQPVTVQATIEVNFRLQ